MGIWLARKVERQGIFRSRPGHHHGQTLAPVRQRALEEDFSESDLPWKVDVVDWAATSESFRMVIERDRVVVQTPNEMNGWRETTLGEVCRLQGGTIQTGPFGSQLHAADYTSIGTPVVMPVNLSAGSISDDGIARVSEENADRLARHKLLPGDIVFSRRGDVTRFALVSERESGWLCGTGCLKVSVGNSSITTPGFVAAVLASPESKEWLIRHAVGATMPNLNTEILASIPITLPPINEQRAIAHILGTLDDKIELNRKQNETLEAMAQAIFKAWFVDFEPVRAKMEGRWQRGQSLPGLPAHLYDLFPGRLVESELGEIPEGWSIGVLGDILSLRNERVMPSNETKMMHYAPIESIGARNLFLSEWKNGGEAKSSLILFKRGDILFGAMRPYFHKVCIAPFDGVTRTTVFTLKPSMPEISAYALILAYQNETVEWATLHSEGSTIPYVKWKNSFEKMPIILPPEELQIRFNNTASPFIENAILNIEENTALAQLRDTLLPKLISGELTNSHCQRNQGFLP